MVALVAVVPNAPAVGVTVQDFFVTLHMVRQSSTAEHDAKFGVPSAAAIVVGGIIVASTAVIVVPIYLI